MYKQTQTMQAHFCTFTYKKPVQNAVQIDTNLKHNILRRQQYITKVECFITIFLHAMSVLFMLLKL